MDDPLRDIPWDTFVYAFTDESDDWHRDYWKYARKDSGLGPIAEGKRRTSVCTLHGSGGCLETCLQIRKLREYRDWLVREFLHWPEDNTIIIIPHQKRAPLLRWRNPGGPQRPGTVYAGHYIWLSDILGCARIDVPVTRVQYDPKDPTPLLEYDPLWVSVLSAPGTDLMLVRAVARLFEERVGVTPWVPKYWPSWKSWNAPAAPSENLAPAAPPEDLAPTAPPESLAPAASSENLESSSGRGSGEGNGSGGGSRDGSGDGSGSGGSKQKGKQKADDNAV